MMGVDPEEEEDPFSFPFDSNSISDLFSAEPDRIPSPAADDLRSNSSLRRNVNSILFQLSSRIADPNPLATYVAAGYADRFLAGRETLAEEEWMAPLLAIACLSLAFKMKKIDLPLSGVHIEDGIAFDAVTIRRAEVMILIALDWQMRSLTPFSFLPFFLSLLPLDDDASIRSGASEIVLNSLRETKMMEFKASVIAASALLRALAIYGGGISGKEISGCSYLDGKELRECCEAMGELCCEMASSSSSRNGTEISLMGDRRRHGSSGDGVVESSTNGAPATDSGEPASNGER